MAQKREIPKKYSKSGKSSFAKIENDTAKPSYSSFGAFPQGVSFHGKDQSEDVILLVRRDLATFIPQYLLVFFFLMMPIIFFAFLGAMDLGGAATTALGIGGSIFFILIAVTIAFDTFIKWYYSVGIITNERLVDVDFTNVLYHRFSETQLENVEDVTHAVAGTLGSLFDFGTVYVQTAGTRTEFEFDLVPRPRDVQDLILDLLEMKQKGEI